MHSSPPYLKSIPITLGNQQTIPFKYYTGISSYVLKDVSAFVNYVFTLVTLTAVEQMSSSQQTKQMRQKIYMM